MRGRVGGLSGFSKFSDVAESSSGLGRPSGIELDVEIDEGLCFRRMTWNVSVEGPSSWVAEWPWPKIPRLLLRRLSDIALAFATEKSVSGGRHKSERSQLNITSHGLIAFAAVAFVVSSGLA